MTEYNVAYAYPNPSGRELTPIFSLIPDTI